jgi:hypothetical protein
MHVNAGKKLLIICAPGPARFGYVTSKEWWM